MPKTTAVGAAIAVVAMSLATSLALVGCGSSNKSASTATTTTTTSKTPSAKIPPRTAEQAPGPLPTIASYIAENGIQETPVHRGDPGSPTVTLPVPPGWADAGTDTPDWAYGAIVYTGPEAADYTPSIVAVVSKLTGNVDPQKIIDLAPGELSNLSGWSPMNEGATSELGGYSAYQLAGSWDDNGTKKIVAQKTVAIPGSDGLYVLQLNADGRDNQAGVLSAATDVIDQQTTITL